MEDDCYYYLGGQTSVANEPQYMEAACAFVSMSFDWSKEQGAIKLNQQYVCTILFSN